MLVYFSSSSRADGWIDTDGEYNRLRSQLQSIAPNFLGPYWPAVTLDQFVCEIARHPRAASIHFSGHGTSDGGVRFNPEGTVGEASGLARMLCPFAGDVRLFVWMVCHSNTLASLLSRSIEASVGVIGAIRDDAAVAFVPIFYSLLTFGDTLSNAFEVARGRVDAEFPGEGDRIALHVRPDRDGREIVMRERADDVRILIQRTSHRSAIVALAPPGGAVTATPIEGRMEHVIADARFVISIGRDSIRVRGFADRNSTLLGRRASIVADGQSQTISSLDTLPAEKFGDKPCILDAYFPAS